ncbi:MAG: MarR family transcriptional regulator [Proteobacteria bacterium]|nr:MarR family transcriptional regulator [Pseudomonadota bacterium]
MSPSRENLTELRQIFFRVVNKVSHATRRPLDYGTGDLLHPSQMHVIERVGESPGISITELARVLGITKGAVSQTVKKLEEMGMVARYKQENNAKNVLLKLGKKGEKTFEAHHEWHQTHDEYFLRRLQQMPQSQYEAVLAFLLDAEASADLYLDEVPCGETVDMEARKNREEKKAG